MQRIYSRTLERAVELLGSAEALAKHLDVPLDRLNSWLNGVGSPPTSTFLRAADVVMDHEISTLRRRADGEPLELQMAGNAARCPKCDGTRFLPAKPAEELSYVAKFVCANCGESMTYGELVVALGSEAAQRGNAAVAKVKKGQAAKAPDARNKADGED